MYFLCEMVAVSQRFVANAQSTSTGSDNDLAPNRRQTITWTKDGLIYWRRYVPRSLTELIQHMYSYE